MILFPLSLLVVHFVADFLLQNNWMALNKSKKLEALTLHCLVYSLCFFPLWGWKFFLITFWTHWLVDFVTSRITSKLWFIDFKKPDPVTEGDLTFCYGFAEVFPVKRHWFFVAIGFDQLIHAATLALTYHCGVLYGWF